jgi:thiol-disulfide isomerase/thioredoxin
MKVWLICTTVILSIIITLYFLLNKKKSTSGIKYADFYYFYTTWCPYCKKSMVEWKNFKQEWNQKTYQGYTLQFHEVDCDIQESLANKYNITQYPTIKLIKNGTIIDFDAKPTISTLTSFLNSSFE